jgi:endonuclease YncB( thermonuclease family)
MRLSMGVIVAVCVTASIANAETFTGKVGKVIDGDTFWICEADKCTKIRFCGFDAPERGQIGFAESRDFLFGLMNGKTIRCVQVGGGTPCDGRSKPTNRDRVVAQCFADGADVGVPMVQSGHACDWTKFSGGHYRKMAGGSGCVR